MRSTQYGRIDQRQTDSILLFETGLGIQGAKERYTSGVSLYRLNKTLAAILRHWEGLRQSSPSYQNLHDWGFRHAPYRFGERVYRQPRPAGLGPSNAFNVAFLEEVLRKDRFLHGLGVRPEQEFAYAEEKEEGNIRFLLPDPETYAAIIENSEIRQADIQLVKNLSRLYSNIDKSIDLAALATCPSEEACRHAMIAEIHCWLWDTERILEKIRPESYSKDIIRHRHDIDRLLSQAFNCGREIGVKRGWYTRVLSIAAETVALGMRLGVEEELLTPLRLSDSGEPSEAIMEIELAAEYLTCFVGFASEQLRNAGIASGLREGELRQALKFLHRLDELGLDDDRRQKITTNGGRRIDSLPYLRDELSQVHQSVLGYLAHRGLPSRFVARDLLGSE